jgi:putative transposase
VKQWLELCGVRTLYIEPGSPWENAYSETFIPTFRTYKRAQAQYL